MTTFVKTLAFGPSSSAATGNFAEFVGFIQTAFTGSGFINQFPSGAINTASVNPPTAVNQVRGYDVYAFGDSLQATQPLFIRVEYRSINTTAFNVWGLNLYFGERHDGSGNLNSVFVTSSVTIGHNTVGGAFSSQQSASALYTGESGSRVAVVMAPFVSGTGGDFPQLWFNINRINDWTGSLTPSGAILHFGGSSGTSPRAGHLYHSMELGKRYAQTAGHLPMLSFHTNSLAGSASVAISPLFVGKGKIEPSSYDVYAVLNGESAYSATNVNITGSQYTLNTYGINRNYLRLPISMGGGTTNCQYSYNPQMALFLRYE